jgi:hypothetical protein
MPLLAAACAPVGSAPSDSSDEDGVSLDDSVTCAAPGVPTELHVEPTNGTTRDQDGCFGVTSALSPGLPPGIGRVWANNHLEFKLASPDGTTNLAVSVRVSETAPFQSGQTVAAEGLPLLSLRSADGQADVDHGVIHFDAWKQPTMFQRDGLITATISGMVTAADGSATVVRAKITGLVLEGDAI